MDSKANIETRQCKICEEFEIYQSEKFIDCFSDLSIIADLNFTTGISIINIPKINPALICPTCLIQLRSFATFKRQALKADENYRSKTYKIEKKFWEAEKSTFYQKHGNFQGEEEEEEEEISPFNPILLIKEEPEFISQDSMNCINFLDENYEAEESDESESEGKPKKKKIQKPTEGNKFYCEICDRYLSSSKGLQIHKIATHNEIQKVFICKHCQEIFKCENYLRRHVKNQHDKNYEKSVDALIKIVKNKEESTKIEDIVISNYLTKFDQGRRYGSCIACGKTVQWAKDRIAAHKRSSCPNISAEEKKLFAKRKPEASNSSQYLSLESLPRFVTEKFENEANNEEIDMKLANFFYRTGVSFNLIKSAAFKDFVKVLKPSYASIMPCTKMLTTSLLEKSYAKVSTEMNKILNSYTNLTLMSNGWSNINGNFIVNFCIKAPNMKPFFYTSINTLRIHQSSFAVAAAVIQVIESFGAQKFNSFICDNATVIKAALKNIEEKFPHITANACAVEALNLLIKEIINNSEASKTIEDAEKVVKFVKNNQIVMTKFEERRKAANFSHSLLMPSSTNFYKSLSELQNLKNILINLVDEEWNNLSEIEPKEILPLIKCQYFWDRLNWLIKLVELPSNFIEKLENDESSLASIYDYFGQLFNYYQNDQIIQGKVKNHLEFLLTPSIGLAYILTPKHAAEGFYFNDHKTDFISSAYEFAMKINPAIADAVQNELITFIGEVSTLHEKRKETIFKMNAKQYWNIIGREKFPATYQIAKYLTEMNCSMSVAEKCWSTFKIVKTRFKNRLTDEQVKKLVFLYRNTLLIDEKDKNDYMFEEKINFNDAECDEIN